MALDKFGLKMIAPYIAGARVLSLGYPDITVQVSETEAILGCVVTDTTDRGSAHKKPFILPETASTLLNAGAVLFHCADVQRSVGCELIVDLNYRHEWERDYEVVINPGTVEHCFDVATAMFNMWRAVATGGVLLNVAPVSMINHGFWNVCPTAIVDFAAANGGEVIAQAVLCEGVGVSFDAVQRCKIPPESVLYSVVKKTEAKSMSIPVQWRYRNA